MSPASNRCNVLTPAIAEQFLQDNSSVSLDAFTDIEDAAARILARHRGILSLHGLEHLSEAAAKSLAAIEPSPETGPMGNSLRLGRLRPTPTVARHLATYRGDQIRFDREAIDLPFVEALARFRGNLWLGKVTHLDDQVATALANRAGETYLGGVQTYQDGPGHLALARALIKWSEDRELSLNGLRKAPDSILQVFAEYNGKVIHLDDPALRKRLEGMRKKLVQSKIREGALVAPEEWQQGRIVLSQPPKHPLRGPGNLRVSGRELKIWWLPKAGHWFSQRLEAAHKEKLLRAFGSVSPEAARLFRQKGDAWFWLMQQEASATRRKAVERLKALPNLQPPPEFRDGGLRLPSPARAVAKAYCWEPDFAGEHYPAVLHYYNYLPAEHVGSITDPKGYPAKAMSPEAAALYRRHRSFWESKHAGAIDERLQATKRRVATAAATAGLSRQELEAKLDRLGELIARTNPRLAAEMIVGFGEPWLHQALLAGATINPEGELKPGQILRRFKHRAELVMLLAIATMPERVETDPSVRREAKIRAHFKATDLEVAEEWITPRLPKLDASCEDSLGIEKLTPTAATFLARTATETLSLECLDKLNLPEAKALSACRNGLSLGALRKLEPRVAETLAGAKGPIELESLESLQEEDARALAAHEGELCLGLKDLSVPVAAALAACRGKLKLPRLRAISAPAAAALAFHRHPLELGGRLEDGSSNGFRLDMAAARNLAEHQGPLILPGLSLIDAKVASALVRLKFYIAANHLTEIPAGEAGLRLCEKIALQTETRHLDFKLPHLTPECAGALAAFKGDLCLQVGDWSDAALIAVAAHPYDLIINPRQISAEAGRALGRRPATSTLAFHGGVSLSDDAAEALGNYAGQLAFRDRGPGTITVSVSGAAYLAKRQTLELPKKSLNSEARKMFAAAGKWAAYSSSWTRRR